MSIIKSPQGFYQSTLLLQVEGLRHAFGTAAAPPPEPYCILHQIHSATIREARECAPGVEGDAIVTNQPGTFVAVKTADCVPILIVDPVHRAVAAVHAGWKGTLARIAQAAVSDLRARYASQPGTLLAAIGPSIRLCCFEVGPEVAVEFQPHFPERNDLDRQTRVDLVEANLRQLRAAGLPGTQIDHGAPCTFCGGAEFYSWRRDRILGQRMFHVIGFPEPTARSSSPTA